MNDFPIPVVAFGAGSHKSLADEGFDYLPMPKAEPLDNPIPPDDADVDELHAAGAVIEQLLESMRRQAPGAQGERFSLRGMAPGAWRVLNECLGQGEVSAIVASHNGKPAWKIQETAFAGVWRVQRDNGRGGLAEDILEAGDVPLAVKEAAQAAGGALLDPARLPPSVMNAPTLVSEIRHHASALRPGMPAHVVNLSLLPLAPADHDGLDALLGEGAVSILSRGFGNCRVNSTRARGVWRVRFFNNMNTVILDTIEVVDIPEAARAATEDLEDSIARLGDLLKWLREG